MSVSEPIPYLDQNALHLKPINAHFFGAIRYATTSLEQAASTEHWHGCLVRALAKTVLFTGYFTNAPIAAAETIITLAAGILGYIGMLITQSRFECLQKYTVKALSYSLHSFTLCFAQAFLFLQLIEKGWSPQSHFMNSLINHSFYMGSAILTQMTSGYLFDQIAGRNSQDEDAETKHQIRISHMFNDYFRYALVDTVRNLGYDLNVVGDWGDALDRGIELFRQNNPETWQRLSNFRIHRLWNDDFRTEMLGYVMQILITSGVAERVDGGDEVALRAVGEADISGYQKHLLNHMKTAFEHIYRQEKIANLLSDDINELKENIDASSAFVQLSNYMQLLELQEDSNICLAKFGNGNDWEALNKRKEKIEIAKRELAKLSESDKNLLIKLIFLGSEKVPLNNSQAQIQKVFNLVGELGGQIYQGKLLVEARLNIHSGSQTHTHLFQKTYQECVAQFTTEA